MSVLPPTPPEEPRPAWLQNLNHRPWLRTYTGKRFHFTDPKADEVEIKDIARGLSNLCRFGGQCKTFYSVAEHCVLVADLLPRNLAFAGLLHDAAEAYLLDVPSPLKGVLVSYHGLEIKVDAVIAKHFSLGPEQHHELVKRADVYAQDLEGNQLMRNWEPRASFQTGVFNGQHVQHARPRCLPPDAAMDLFLRTFEAVKIQKEELGG